MNHIEFTLTPSCPLMCSYCPQTAYIDAYKKLNDSGKKFTSLEDFKTMLDNVEHIVPDVYFTGYTEPLLNKNWYEICQYTIESGYRTHFNTTLAGAKSEHIDKMVNLNMEIRVHLTDSDLVIKPAIYEELIQKHRQLRGYDPTFDTFTQKGASIQVNTNVLYHHAQSRTDNIKEDWVIKTHHPYAVGCNENRQFSNVILPNGDVNICCQDFGLTNIMGNLLTTKLREIHRSEKMNEFIETMMSPKESICRTCTYAYRLPDDPELNHLHRVRAHQRPGA